MIYFSADTLNIRDKDVKKKAKQKKNKIVKDKIDDDENENNQEQVFEETKITRAETFQEMNLSRPLLKVSYWQILLFFHIKN